MLHVKSEEAGRFLLYKNGLLGKKRYKRKDGILAFLHEAGCIQTDEIDDCGKAHELTLLSRVEGFNRGMLSEMLFRDYSLRKVQDKGACLAADTDWPLFTELRSSFTGYLESHPDLFSLAGKLENIAAERGFVTSDDAGDPHTRNALEALCYSGRLRESRTVDGLPCYIPDPSCNTDFAFGNEEEGFCARIWRRIGGTGLLANLPGEVWLGIERMTPAARANAFERLEKEEAIVPVRVEGFSYPLYCRAEDISMLKEGFQANERSVKLLSPFDNLLWDRKLVSVLFSFSYKWEYYTPPEYRQYGAYVLPVLYGTSIVGRIEPVFDRQASCLRVVSFWPEQGFRGDNRFWWAVEDELALLARFLGGNRVVWADQWMKT